MEEQFVTYEIALALKELGFNEPCFGAYYSDGELVALKWYDNNNHRIDPSKITAPLWQQAIDWFRKKHNLNVEIHSNSSDSWCCLMPKFDEYGSIISVIPYKNYKTFEECRKESIGLLINYLKGTTNEIFIRPGSEE